jgi:hypothetical protein
MFPASEATDDLASAFAKVGFSYTLHVLTHVFLLLSGTQEGHRSPLSVLGHPQVPSSLGVRSKDGLQWTGFGRKVQDGKTA